jgi:hypothetical protein
MAGPECFASLFGVCVSQANAISGALVAAIASLATTGWKIWFDARVEKSRQGFEQRQNEQQQEFEQEQAKVAREAEERIEKNLKSYINLEEWKKTAWKSTLDRLELAHTQLKSTCAGLCSLIDDGPHFSDLRMIAETAKVLDVFGDFQSTVGHFSCPTEIAAASQDLIALSTQILLTLSPAQQVRQSRERREMLEALKQNLILKVEAFFTLCRAFQRDPSRFL